MENARYNAILEMVEDERYHVLPLLNKTIKTVALGLDGWARTDASIEQESEALKNLVMVRIAYFDELIRMHEKEMATEVFKELGNLRNAYAAGPMTDLSGVDVIEVTKEEDKKNGG